MTGTQTPTRVIRFRGLRGAVDKVPTKWFAGVIIALFLAGSAAFGGLTEVKKVIPEYSPGDTLSFAQVDVSVSRAVVVDALPDLYIEPEVAGNRLLGLVVTAKDNWDRPISSSSDVRENIRLENVEGLDPEARPRTVLRLDDDTASPDLQPGVPVELIYFWEVPADAVVDGDEILVGVYDKGYVGKGTVTAGDYYSDPQLVARLRVDVHDAGSGVGGDLG